MKLRVYMNHALGGFRYTRTATEIRVGDIERLSEGDLELVECFNPKTNSFPVIAANEGELVSRTDATRTLPRDIAQ
ncbi:hypothetical protein SAMN02745148_03355 [Modicisalibacter ilicicola DSM 19980]|uniref:Uncharacterized protein n=1 Tax=Modicisalibacter ilicicola DSM 19980 TaxID=1121942 RepID=A0A1M5DW07_9GAMM|nr:hypothetical protein [Halomonas ilicicola]SHF71173.1 hypothetical protein SAMN02745148_03355 [Halomonas ilicicola DSM 19980]